MRFLLCARDRTSGTAHVVAGRAYPTASDAVDAVAAAEGRFDLLDCDLFLVDLDAAAPVVLVAVSGDAVPRPVERPPAPLEADSPVVAPQAGEPGPAVGLDASGDDEGAAHEWRFVDADEDPGVGPSTLAGDLAADDVDRAQMWWVEVGADLDAGGAVAPVAGDEVASGGSGVERAPEAAAAVPVTRPTEEEPAPEVESAFPEKRRAAASGAYPVTGVDLGVWTCDDCVFLTTCPRSGNDRPSTCGTFQWTSE
jgi:hypothetical protein